MEIIATIEISKFPIVVYDEITNNMGLTLFNCPTPKDGIYFSARVNITDESKEYHDILKLCEKNNLDYMVYRNAIFSKQELNKVPLFILNDEPIELGAEEYNEINPGCPHCGTGRTLRDPLMVTVRKLRKTKISTYIIGDEFVFVIPKQFAELFTGFLECSLELIKDRSKKICPDFLRLKIGHKLSWMDGKTNFWPNGRSKCNFCRRPGWTLYDNAYYIKDIINEAKDFNLTREGYGGARALQWLVISQRAREIMLKAKILVPYNFKPVLLLDEASGFQNKIKCQ